MRTAQGISGRGAVMTDSGRYDRMEMLQHGIQPFWFWNGEMDDNEIVRQIGEMDEKGFHGFLIHPRQGMEVPYLSSVYFEKVRVAVNEAKKRGMEVWLYDEFPYPSGIGGGKVTLEHPEYSCLELTKTTGVFTGPETAKLYAPWGRVVMAKAYPVKDGMCCWEESIDLKDHVGSGYRQDVFQMSGLTKYNKKRYFQGELSQYLYWKVPEGTWKVYLYTEAVMKHFKYFETFIDPLNPKAVRMFLETTHEQYKKYLGDEFGKTIRGVFTDEVTAFPPSCPWSVLLPGLVREQTGLELTEYLPALTEDMGELTEKIRYAYWNAATEQFIESWDKQVYDWCEQNHLLYIGEKPILRSKELKYTHVPGIDAGHQKFGSRPVLAGEKYRANGKIASSAAHFYGKPAALCEAFHSIGWGMTLQDCKWIFDWLTVMGIDWFITHGAYYTTDALKKHDAPPSSFYQMPWWRDMPQLTEYTDRLNRFLMSGRRRVSVLLLDPVTSTWTQIGTRREKLQKNFADLQNRLLRSGTDYYIMDPELFAEGNIAGENGVTEYCNGEDRFSILVLPYMTNLERKAYLRLQEYVMAGGTVIAVGTVPYWEPDLCGSDGQKTCAGWFSEKLGMDPEAAEERYFAGEFLQETAKENCFFAGNMDAAVSRIGMLEKKMRLWTVSTDSDCEILTVQKQTPEKREVLFAVNLSDKAADVRISFGKKTLKQTLAGGESLFLDDGEMEKSGSPEETEGKEQAEELTIEWDPDEILPMQADSLNALRIGQWEMCLPDARYAQVESVPVIDQMEEAGLMIPVCQKDYFGCPKELEFPVVEAVYAYCFRDMRRERTPVLLVMEPGTLLGDWKIRVNGHTVYTEADFESRPVFLPSNLAVDLSEVLVPGENLIEIEMKTDKSFGGIRNPLYLCGVFAADRADGTDRLLPLKTEGKMTDLTASGYPFYAGSIKYEKKLPEAFLHRLRTMPSDTPVRIKRKEQVKFHEALRIRAGAAEPVIRAFAPYDVVTTAQKLLDDPVIRIWYDTSLSQLFEGEVFEEEAHRYMPVL